MDRFKLDELLVVICFAGISGLFLQLILSAVGIDTPGGYTGAFVTLATAPVGIAAGSKVLSKRDDPPDDDPPSPVEQERTARDDQKQKRSDLLAVAV